MSDILEKKEEFAVFSLGDPNLHLWTMDAPLFIKGHLFLAYFEAFFGYTGWRNLLLIVTSQEEYPFSLFELV
jgi:hypothetical protein